MKYENEIIDISDMDREVAILIYKDKIYEDVNHQYALEKALNNYGESLTLNIDENIDELSELTYKLSKENTISTFDIFADGRTKYLISHFEENLRLSIDIIKKYASQHNLILGTFLNFKDSTCKILRD